jgi:hypothetical protein
MGQFSSEPHCPPAVDDGVTALEGADGELVPTPFVAVTVKV